VWVYVYDYASGYVRTQGGNAGVNDDGTITVLSNGIGLSFNLANLITYTINGATLSLYF
jgi:hypothetical protein